MRKLILKLEPYMLPVLVITFIIFTAFAVVNITNGIKLQSFTEGYDAAVDEHWDAYNNMKEKYDDEHQKLVHALEYFDCGTDLCIYEATGDCHFYGGEKFCSL